MHTDSLLARRDLLLAFGSMISASTLLACTSSLGPLEAGAARQRAQDDARRDAPRPDMPVLVQALVLGLNAPSAHNTQAWKFKLLSDREALLYVDATRLLPNTDPPARQIHISCGCFAEAFALGASRFGRRAQVDLFPEGRYASPADIGRLPVARLTLAEGGTEDPLATYIEARQTSRLPYEGPQVTPALFEPVVADARLRSAHVSLVSGNEMSAYLDLFDRAMTKESLTVATNEETRRWFRFRDSQIAERRDGFTFEHNGVTGFKATLARWFTSDTKESWNAKGTIEKGLSAFREGLHSARGIVLLSTDANRYEDQVEAGRDCYRLMLSLTRHGYFAHPHNQVIQEYEGMRELRERFEALSKIHEPAKVQMILRVGQSETPALSYRRHANDFFIKRA